MENLLQNLRHAFRSLARHPGFTAVVVFTLGLGIGASTGIFSLVNAVLIQPLPYPHADRLVAVQHVAPGFGIVDGGQSDGTYLHYQEHNRVFDEIGAYLENVVSLTDHDDPERIQVALVTPSVFSVLGVTPQHGRPFTPEDGAPDVRNVMISHELWVRRYGADPGIIGRTIETNRTPDVVVGIMPPGFDFPSRQTHVWYAMGVEASKAGVRDLYLGGVARLKPGVSPEAAQADLQRLIPGLANAYPDASEDLLANAGFSAAVKPLKEVVVGKTSAMLWILLGAAGFVLLIACANVANLFLIRAEHRQKEVAVRMALGAGRGDLVRYFVGESLLLALLGGIFGFLLADVAIGVLISFGPENIPRLHEVRTSGWVLAFAASLSILASLLFSAVPILRYSRPNLTSALKQSAGGATAARERQWGRRLLVASQVALALTLLIGSALMVQSFWKLKQVDLGFQPAEILTFELNPPARPYLEYPKAARLHHELLERLRVLPGVTAAEAVLILPLTTTASYFNAPFTADGQPTRPGEIPPPATINFATPGYFEAMRIPLVRGRGFQAGDLRGESPPVIISTEFARLLFGTQDPIGRRVRFAEKPKYPSYTVVGVVGSVPGETIPGGASRMLYFPVLDDLRADPNADVPIPFVPREMTIVVQTSLPPTPLVPAVRRILRDLDPKIPISRVRTMEQIVAASTAHTSLAMVLLLTAACIALFLGSLGVYGVVSYVVTRRTREIGIRIALGAHAASVSRMVLRQGAGVVLIGIAIGSLAALVLTRFLRSLLFEVSPSNPITFIVMSLLLLTVALLASYLPARRAARVDPMIALRSE